MEQHYTSHNIMMFARHYVASREAHVANVGSSQLDSKTSRHTPEVGVAENKYSSRYAPKGASCVQSFDDSLSDAIRMTYRISLRSSSLWEPRHPLLKVCFHCIVKTFRRKPIDSCKSNFTLTSDWITNQCQSCNRHRWTTFVIQSS